MLLFSVIRVLTDIWGADYKTIIALGIHRIHMPKFFVTLKTDIL